MLVVGDSRVRELEKAAGDMVCTGWRLEFVYAPGANLDQAVGLIEEWRKNQYPDRPKMIVMISFFHDLVVKTKLSDGTTFLTMADGVMGKGPYPSVQGLEKKIRDVEGKLKGWLKDLEILWIDPYPIDVRRWTESRLMEGRSLSLEEIDKCHQLSFDLANWLDRTNCVGTRIKGMGDRFIPWYVLWNDQKRSDVNFSAFRNEYKSGVKFGWINRTRTIDGFLPARGLSTQTMKMLFRKAWQSVPPPSSLSKVVLAEKPKIKPVCRQIVDDNRPTPLPVKKNHDQKTRLRQQPEKPDVKGLMEKITEVELYSKHLKKALVQPASTRPAEFRSVPADIVRVYSKTAYPCGHYLPFKLDGDAHYTPKFHECPVCKKNWSGREIVKNTFHYYQVL